MRSIASSWEQQVIADPAVSASSLSFEGEDGELVEPYAQAPDPAPSPERQAAGREELAVLIEHFKDDPVASLVITCLTDGTPLSELAQLGISDNQCAAAKKKVRRHAARLLSRGGNP